MKFKATLMNPRTGKDAAGGLYTQVIMRIYEVPETGSPIDPEARQKAMWLTGLMYNRRGEMHWPTVDIEVKIPE